MICHGPCAGAVNPPMQLAVAGPARQVGRVILAGGIGSAVE
jgi:hypothetical protein